MTPPARARSLALAAAFFRTQALDGPTLNAERFQRHWRSGPVLSCAVAETPPVHAPASSSTAHAARRSSILQAGRRLPSPVRVLTRVFRSQLGIPRSAETLDVC